MLISLLRHGEVEGPALVFRGRSDPPLTELGQEQMRRAALAFERPRIDRLVSSPRRRCLTFAMQWSQQHGVALTTRAALSEIDFGAWEELSPQEARRRDPQCYARLQSRPDAWCSPHGESYADFRARVLGALHELCGDGIEHLGIVTHAGVMRVILCELLDLAPRNAQCIALVPAASCRIWWDATGRRRLLELRGGNPS